MSGGRGGTVVETERVIYPALCRKWILGERRCWGWTAGGRVRHGWKKLGALCGGC